VEKDRDDNGYSKNRKTQTEMKPSDAIGWEENERRKSEKMKRTEINLTEKLTDLEQTVSGEASQHFLPRPVRRAELSQESERDQRIRLNSSENAYSRLVFQPRKTKTKTNI
jgi:hypothetical protein